MPTVPVLLDVAQSQLPLQPYLMTREEVALVDRARIAAINECLPRLGIDGQIEVPPPQPGPASITERRYGLTDAALAVAQGYRLGDGVIEPPPAPDLGPEGDAVLLGTAAATPDGVPIPAGGCMGEANRELATAVPAGVDQQLAMDLSSESYFASMRDSRVQAALAGWSECMAGHGYDYADSLAPFDDPALGAGESEAAREVAEADVHCKQRTNLVGTWFTVESAYQERLIAANAEALERVRQAIAAQLEWARRVTGP